MGAVAEFVWGLRERSFSRVALGAGVAVAWEFLQFQKLHTNLMGETVPAGGAPPSARLVSLQTACV